MTKAKVKTSISAGTSTLKIECTDSEDFYDIIKAVSKVTPIDKIKVDPFQSEALRQKLLKHNFNVKVAKIKKRNS